jgi:signal transduction histidine kinase
MERLAAYVALAYQSQLKKQAKMPVAGRHGILLAFILGAWPQAAAAQPTNVVLTNAVDVLTLPGERAWGHPVRIRGVVTAAQPSSTLQPDWDGRFFVQDATAGVFAEDSNHRRPEPGDVVEVTGTSHPGGFAPFISYAQWTRLGTAPLPPAKIVPIEQLMAGIEDSQRVEISGVVRSFREDKLVVLYEITSGGYRLKVYAPPLPGIDPQTLIGAKVRIRGTASTVFSGQLRQIITAELDVPAPSDFMIEQLETADPFAEPMIPLNHLAQYRRDRHLEKRVHVKGTVTYQRRGQDLFLQDTNKGIQVKSRLLVPVAPGDVVEAVGFLDFEHYLPVLQDAVYRKTADAPAAVTPKSVATSELRAGYGHAEMITLQGRLLDHALRRGDAGFDPALNLTLQDSNLVFTAEVPAPQAGREEPSIPIGSRLAVTGVCLMEIDENGALHSLQMLVPDWSQVRILQQPSWWTPRRLLIGLAALVLVLLVALSWSVMVLKRNAALQAVIREKVKAQHELQQAHDLLETRVEQRTAQLKDLMTARQEAEVRFKATLTERTRLAQELHDTLEQSLTGIALQLDTADKLFEKDAAGGKHHVGMARHLMKQSQIELRRSIWDLRSRELEQFDFPEALRMSAQQIAGEAGLGLNVGITGDVRALSEVAEENLLRISQEALTNVIKHAGATQVTVSLEFGPQAVTLRIADNGCGFNPQACPGTREGHFGLQGMSERAKRIDGCLRVSSNPGSGTCLEAQIPARPGNGASHAAAAVPPEPT